MKIYFNRFTILEKIFVGSIIFALPIIVLLSYMVSGFNHDISFARLESCGNKLLMPLETIAELIPKHQLLVRLHIEGDKNAEEKINLLAQDIEKQFSILQTEGRKSEDLLQISEKNLKAAGIEHGHISEIYKKWQGLRSNWKNNGTTENDDAHEVMILRPVCELIKRVGDTSNMVLDPSLDTTYLIDIGLLTMPKIQEKLGLFMLFAESVIYKGYTSQEDRIKFAVFSAMLEDELKHINQSVETILRESKKLHDADTLLQKNIPPLLEEYKTSIIPFLFILKRFSNDPNFKIPAMEFFESAKNVLDSGARLRETSMLELQGLLDKREKSFVNKRFSALFMSLSMLFFASVIVVVISQGITRSLRRVIDIAGEIAEGNLKKAMEDLDKTRRIDLHLQEKTEGHIENHRNEIHRLFRAIATMTSSLYALLIQVGKSGIQVSTSSVQIAASARQLEATVAEQASSINEVSATSNEISATSQEFAKTMNIVSKMASEAAEMASASMSSLSDINTTMKKLLENTTESSGKLRVVNEKMDNITQVITTITKVANQINLLSLNAAIEAEKAGEYGIGFSVVAREIRRLADQTAVSALDIEGMIMETREAMRDGARAVELYTDQTRTSTERIAEISVDLLRAIEHTQELVPQFESVNQGMQMQSQSASQISESMGHLNQAARQTRDSLIEFRGVTEQLNTAVKDLENEVTRFSINS
ncbi:MAG: methyl-accepting chemotaxis protein [Proteobacteria bacterium]|nr:methyl-accepting chemotaxis protein [Pseudomonadota bacterium]